MHVVVLFDLLDHPLNVGICHGELLLNFILSSQVFVDDGLVLLLVIRTFVSLWILAGFLCLVPP